MISPEGFQALRRRLEEMTRDRDQAAGGLDELVRQLRHEFGVGTEAAAKALLDKIAREMAEIDKDYQEVEKELEADDGG